jgi:hypothetical protein
MKFLVAFKIWIIAVVINTLLGAAWLTYFFSDQGSIAMYLFFGFAFCVMASFPIYIGLLIVINRSVSKNDYGKMIFIKVLITGIILSIIAFLLFFYFWDFGLQGHALFLCTLLSSVISVSSQHKSLMRLQQFDDI